MTSWLYMWAESYLVWVRKGGVSEVQVTIGEVVNVHSSVVSLRCVFLKVVWSRRLVKVPFKMYGSQAPRAMSVFISRYCESVSLSSRGRSVYSALGCGVICKEGSKIRFKGGEDSRETCK